MLLVTGGAGFIGSNFVLSTLAETGEAIVNLDNLTCAGNLQNLASLKGHPGHIFGPANAQLRVIPEQRSLVLRRIVVGRLVDDLGVVGHLAESMGSPCSGFACAIFREKGITAQVTPIATSDYPTPARRPRNSVLDNAALARNGIRRPSWDSGLRDVLASLA